MGQVPGKGERPLHRAAAAGDMKALQELLDAVPDPATRKTALAERNKDQRTPVREAVRYNRADALRLMASMGADMHELNHNKNSLLHTAALYGATEVAEFLLCDIGLDPCQAGKNGSTPMHAAAQDESLEVLRLIMTKLPSTPIDVVNALGQTPLFKAAATGQVAAAHYLLDHGANPCAADSNGATPIDVCMSTKILAELKAHAPPKGDTELGKVDPKKPKRRNASLVMTVESTSPRSSVSSAQTSYTIDRRSTSASSMDVKRAVRPS
jgi:ankyrin repeat protein